MVHIKCRNNVYPFSKISRLTVADYQILWSFPWADYNPPEYNSDVLKGKPWADLKIGESFQPKWNTLDGNVNRKSHTGNYVINNDGYPLNPEGRTGLKGRGVLGRWGPNHAADPIITRWRRIGGQKQFNDMPTLQVCVIQRKDCNEWALPGGMVDPGEHISVTLKREFMEEALNSLEHDSEQKSMNEAIVNNFFAAGVELYKGYVDDPRNTDNAWMETVAVNFHDETGTAVGKFSLRAGDDAKDVKWIDIDQDLALYASHSKFIEKVVVLHKAHW